MSSYRRCDYCGQEDEREAVGWFYINQRVSPSSSGTGWLGSNQYVGDFCSWPCVSAYAEAQGKSKSQNRDAVAG